MNSKATKLLCSFIFLGLITFPTFAMAEVGVDATMDNPDTAGTGVMDQAELEVDLTVGWHSSFMTDGREDFIRNGQGTGMTSYELAASYQGFFAAIWFGQSTTRGDNEQNYIIGKEFDMGPVSLALSYVYLDFGFKDATGAPRSHRLALSASCGQCLPLAITPKAKIVYKMRRGGYKTIFSLSRDFEIASITVSPYWLFQYDHDYAGQSDSGGERDASGIINYELGVSADMPLADNITLGAYVTHSFEGPELRKDARRRDADGDRYYTGDTDITWAGVTLNYQF